ncbi:hypothetical protein ACWFQ8_30010 [Streptomyces sp. NPDC055254]
MTITTRVLGPEPVDPAEPRAVQLRKAGEGAFWYGLRGAGWSDVQISNSLQAFRESVAHELAEQIRSVGVDVTPDMSESCKAIRQARGAVADLIDPEVEMP